MNNDKKMDSILKDALLSNLEPDTELNQKIMRQWKEKEEMKDIKRKGPVFVVTAICALLLSVTVVGAAVKYLNSENIAKESGNQDAIKAFSGENSMEINEKKQAGGYFFTLLGISTGEKLGQEGLKNESTELEKSYAVIAIEKEDGSAMPSIEDEDYGKLQLFISPLIQGLKPWQYNIASMNGGYYEIEKEGILYRMIECDNIEKFADKKLYLCISNTIFYSNEAFQYDEATGSITVNENYDGINLLFDLPIDKSKANPEEAETYLKGLGLFTEEIEDREEEIDPAQITIDVE